MSDDDMIRRGDAVAMLKTLSRCKYGYSGKGFDEYTDLDNATEKVIRAVPAVQPSPDVVALLREALQDALMWTDDDQNRAGWRGKARAALARVKGATEYERKAAQMKEDFPNGI